MKNEGMSTLEAARSAQKDDGTPVSRWFRSVLSRAREVEAGHWELSGNPERKQLKLPESVRPAFDRQQVIRPSLAVRCATNGMESRHYMWRRVCDLRTCIAPDHFVIGAGRVPGQFEKFAAKRGGASPIASPKLAVTRTSVGETRASEIAELVESVTYAGWKFSVAWDSRGELVLTVQRPNVKRSDGSVTISVDSLSAASDGLTDADLMRQVTAIVKRLRAEDVDSEMRIGLPPPVAAEKGAATEGA